MCLEGNTLRTPRQDLALHEMQKIIEFSTQDVCPSDNDEGTMADKSDGYVNLPESLLAGGYMAEVGGTAFCVYIQLRRLCNEGKAWPSYTILEQRTGFGRTTIKRALAKLYKANWIKRMKMGTTNGGASVYEVTIVEDRGGVKSDTEVGSNRTQRWGQIGHRGGVKSDTEVGSNRTPTNTSILLPKTNSPSPANAVEATPRKVKPKYEEIDRKITESIQELIQAHQPDFHFAAPAERHYHDVYLLRTRGNAELDGPISEDRIRAVYKWLKNEDDFWIPRNIRSMDKFRKQFGRLEVAAKNAKQEEKPVPDPWGNGRSWDEFVKEAYRDAR